MAEPPGERLRAVEIEINQVKKDIHELKEETKENFENLRVSHAELKENIEILLRYRWLALIMLGAVGTLWPVIVGIFRDWVARGIK